VVMTEETLRQGIKARQFGRKVYTFETIDSTNNCAKALAGCFRTGGHRCLCRASIGGQGTSGRAWEANPNENLMFSVILRPSLSPEAVNLLPLYAAVGRGRWPSRRRPDFASSASGRTTSLIGRKKFAAFCSKAPSSRAP